LGLTGRERYDIEGLAEGLVPRGRVRVRATAADGTAKTFAAVARVDTPDEVEAARAGGRRTLAYFSAGPAVEWKADGTPVTAADREAERAMREVIARVYPEHGVLGEEEGEVPGAPGVRWIIDPLDGTKTFVRGVPLFGTLVGVEVDGEAVVGVI